MSQLYKSIKKGWFVLYVKYKHEKRIHGILNEKNIESFLPLVETIKQWSDRKKKVTVPLFPSYLFVNLNDQKDIETILNMKESCFFLKTGSEIAIVRQYEIDIIKQFLNLEGITNINSIEVEVGKPYKVNYGPLKNLECEVYRVNSNSNKVKIRIASINQDITATIPNYYLQPIKS